MDSDKRPTMRDRKPFRFLSQPLSEHLKKMDETQSISCSILKYMKVPAPRYGDYIVVIMEIWFRSGFLCLVCSNGFALLSGLCFL